MYYIHVHVYIGSGRCASCTERVSTTTLVQDAWFLSYIYSRDGLYSGYSTDRLYYQQMFTTCMCVSIGFNESFDDGKDKS